MKLSACMITKNEEKNIAKCINSYKTIVSEIIVVDTGSTDKTIEIAKELGAKVFSFEWVNDFAKAKNYAISKAKGDWIIFLDADEYFDVESASKIQGFLKNLKNTELNAIGCKIINIDQNKNNKVQGSFLNVRIFKNDKNIRYVGNIHEHLHNGKGQINIAAYYNDINIYHTGYSTDINVGKAQRNLDILLSNMDQTDHKEEFYHYLSDCYFTIGDYEKAIQYAKLHIADGKELIGNNTKSYINIIQSLVYLKVPKKELEIEIKNAIDRFPDHPNFYLSYADFLFGEMRYEESIAHFIKFLNCKKEYKGIEADHTDGFLDIAYMKTGFLYQMKNEEENALTYYYKCLLEDKYHSSAFRSLFYIVKQQDMNDIIKIFSEIYKEDNENDIEFIISELIKIKEKEVLGYYINIWYKHLGYQDNYLLMFLLFNGKYDTCFNMFYEAYRQEFGKEHGLYAIVSALLSNDCEKLEQINQYTKPSYKRIVEAWQNNNVTLYHHDVEDYMNILQELIPIADSTTLNKYIDLRLCFLPQDKAVVVYRIGKLMQDFYLHDQAITFYLEYMSFISENEDIIKELYMAIGYCYYKQKEYKSACDYFAKAIESNYTKYDIFEFLKWISEKTSDSIKEYAKELMDQYTKQRPE